jgi:hypothetical protein
MKPILGFAALLAWLSSCPDINFHRDHHHDAGQPTEDAGPDVTCGTDDASVPKNDAAVGGGDAGTPPVIEDASVGIEDLDATLIDPPDAFIVEEPAPPVIVPAGQCDTTGLGLYQPGYCDDEHLADGVLKYKPQFELWSDGAIKDRYVYLPPGTYIDTTDPDRWGFPQGTKFWKAFKIQGKRIETRLLTKVGADNLWTSWTAVAFAWSENQSVAAPVTADGLANALGTDHDIPKQTQCTSCHNMAMRDGVNGFGAIQLNYDPPADPSGLELVTLRSLIFRGQLRNGAAGLQNVYADQARLPGDPKTQAALGYLHANCGNCHGGPSPKRGMALWAKVNVRNVADMPAFEQTCGKCLAGWYNKPNTEVGNNEVYKHRIVPGDAAESGIIGRMSAHMPNTNVRVASDQMPPMGTEFLDNAGLLRVRDWIDALAPTVCPLVDVCVAPPPPAMPAAAGAGGAGGAGGAAGAAGTPPTTP